MLRLLLLMYLSFLVLPSNLWADEPSTRHIEPPKQSISDASLKDYLCQLSAAVTSTNKDQLLQLMADDILITFGPPPSGSIEKNLRLDDPKSQTWYQLDELIKLGGDYVNEDQYCLPYLYVHFPTDLDPYEYAVLTQPSVAVHRSASASSEIITYLDYTIIRTDLGMPTKTKDTEGNWWTKVYIDESSAYIQSEYLRSPVDARACIERSPQGWVMKHFILGD